nr:reverse transcriptase domain-containing protein [Tanacetum cinerariifolium]
MSTRSSARNLFAPLDNPKLIIRRRSRADPTLLNEFEMAAEGNGDPPVLDLRTKEKLCQPSLNGRGGPIAPIAIQATNFRLKNDMIQHSIKVNGVTDDAFCLYLFPHSLTHHATTWFDRLPRNSINTFEQMAKMFLGKYFPPSMVMKLRNKITNFCQSPNESLFEAWERYKLSIYRCPNHNMLLVTQIDTFYNDLTLKHRDTINAAACGTFMKRHPEESLKAEKAEISKKYYKSSSATIGQTQNVYAARAYQGGNSYQPQGRNQFFQRASHGQNPPLAYQAPAYQALGYQAPVHQPSIPQLQVVTTNEFTNYMKANDAILKNMQANMTSLTNSNLKLKNMFGMDECLALANLVASINLMPLSVWNKLSIPKLSPTCMTLKLANRLISRPVGVAEDVFVKVGTFHFLANFVVDPRVSLILRRSFLKIRRALIDVFKGELTLRVGKEAITFTLDQTSRYSANYNDMTAKRIDIIDMACEVYSQEVLSFSYVIVSGNPTTYYDLIVSTSSPTLTPFGNSDFLLEKVDAFLALEDDPASPKVDISYYDTEGDTLFLEAFLNNDPSLLLPIKKNICLNPWVSPIHCVPKKGGFTVVENEENELIPTRLVMGWRVCIDYRKLNEATCKDHFPLPFMDQMLERFTGDEYYCFLDGFSGYFQIPINPKDQEKTTFTCPYGTFAYRRIPFGLCNAPDTFQREGIILDHRISKNGIKVDKAKVNVIAKLPHPTTVKGVIIGKRHEKHFRPIHYASKTMIEAESHYTTTEKEMLAVVYTFEKFRSYLIMNKSIVYTDHSALKYLFAKNIQRRDCFDGFSYFKRFGTPDTIISDRGTHFCNDQFAKVNLKYSVTYRLTTMYHPQTSGQVEVSNRGLKRILKRRVGKNCASWSDKLNDALWAFHIAFKRPIRLKLFSSKLKTRWFGPFTITYVFPYGTVELPQTDRPNIKVKLGDPKQALRGRNSWILKTRVGFCPSVFTSSASLGNHISKSNRLTFIFCHT